MACSAIGAGAVAKRGTGCTDTAVKMPCPSKNMKTEQRTKFKTFQKISKSDSDGIPKLYLLEPKQYARNTETEPKL